MHLVWNILLGLGTLFCAAALIFQGFAFPALSPVILVLLRIAGAACLQWLFLRLRTKKPVRAIPFLAAACWSVWGFFLYLTSPSWRNVTFGHFLSDNASFLCGTVLVWSASWLLPRLIPRIKRAIRRKQLRKQKEREYRTK